MVIVIDCLRREKGSRKTSTNRTKKDDGREFA